MSPRASARTLPQTPRRRTTARTTATRTHSLPHPNPGTHRDGGRQLAGVQAYAQRRDHVPEHLLRKAGRQLRWPHAHGGATRHGDHTQGRTRGGRAGGRGGGGGGAGAQPQPRTAPFAFVGGYVRPDAPAPTHSGGLGRPRDGPCKTLPPPRTCHSFQQKGRGALAVATLFPGQTVKKHCHTWLRSSCPHTRGEAGGQVPCAGRQAGRQCGRAMRAGSVGRHCGRTGEAAPCRRWPSPASRCTAWRCQGCRAPAAVQRT